MEIIFLLNSTQNSIFSQAKKAFWHNPTLEFKRQFVHALSWVLPLLDPNRTVLPYKPKGFCLNFCLEKNTQEFIALTCKLKLASIVVFLPCSCKLIMHKQLRLRNYLLSACLKQILSCAISRYHLLLLRVIEEYCTCTLL